MPPKAKAKGVAAKAKAKAAAVGRCLITPQHGKSLNASLQIVQLTASPQRQKQNEPTQNEPTCNFFLNEQAQVWLLACIRPSKLEA